MNANPLFAPFIGRSLHRLFLAATGACVERALRATLLIGLAAGLPRGLALRAAETFADPAFASEVVATVPSFTPVGVAWAPDGRMFIWQKNGVVRIFTNGALLPTPFLDFSGKVNLYNDNGMWGLALDPDFAATGYLYLSYVYEPNGNPNDATSKVSRFVRVRANPAAPDTMLAGSEVELMPSLPVDYGTHAIGTIRFAPDGTLFLAYGDGASPFNVDPNAVSAQDLNSVRGKIFRIRRDGTAPSDNPFYDGTDSLRSKIWCYGVRNPFRFSVHPTLRVPYFADVGWSAWEEVNRGVAGGNFGWPFYEGNGLQPDYQPQLPLLPPGTDLSAVIPPLVTYSHAAGQLGAPGTCIVGGDFYTGSQYPQAYQGNYFFADYSSGWIHRAVLDASGGLVSVATFASGIAGPSFIEQGPDGLLYYGAFANGEVRRIRYNGVVAVAAATPRYGYSPLAVAFSSAGTTNPAGGTLTTAWDFGDGTASTEANPVHTYAQAGVATLTARLTATNALGQSSVATVPITVGSTPPTPTILAPANQTGYLPGQVVSLSGAATDPDDGALPANALTWTILLHHNAHVHTAFSAVGAQASFPTEHHGSTELFFYEVRLSATDSSGLIGTSAIELQILPDTIAPTAPADLTATPVSFSRIDLSWSPASDNAAVEGYVIERSGGGNAAFVQVGASKTTTFSDAIGVGANTTYTYRMQTLDASGNVSVYSANATATTPSRPLPAGLVAAYSFDEGAGMTAGDASGQGNTGSIGSATWTTGKFGGALQFNGTTARVTIPHSASINLTTAMTLEAWVYPTAIGDWRDIVYKGPNDIYYLMGSSYPSGRPALGGTFAAAEVFGATTLPLNAWSHLAGTYDGAVMRFYVNGVLASTRAQTGLIRTSTGALSIGGDALYGQYWAGRIDEVAIYNRALTAAEIQSDMSTAIGAATPNTPPTISSVGNQSLAEDSSGAVAIVVGDAETPAASLQLSASSSNSTLLPNGAIAFGGSGTNRTVTITPAANLSGSATVTLTVSDGALNASTSFLVTVTPVNDGPSISTISDQTVNTGTSVGPLSFTVGDLETAAGSLVVTATSDNPTLLPNANLVLGGAGGSRTLSLTPASAQSGTARVTLTVSDGALTASSSFALTVTAIVNTPPTISDVADRTINEDASTGAIGFTVGDSETAAGSLVVTALSSDTTLVPAAGLVLGGTGANRTISVTPAANRFGAALITLTVSDGAGSATGTFTLTVTAVNDVPTLTAIANQTTTTNTSVGPLAFTVADVETPATSLVVTASSSNPVLLPAAGIVLGGTGASRSITLTPATGQTGSATITVNVSDGTANAERSFTLTVNAPPSGGLMAAYNFDEGAGTTLNDQSGNGNHGTITAATWTTGKYGSALLFNGTSALVTVPGAPSLNASTALTIEAWVYPTVSQTGWRALVQRQVDAYFLHASNNTTPLRPAAGGTFNGGVKFAPASSSIAVNVWSHVAMTYDGKAIRMYVNGTQVAAKAATGALEANSNPLRIGGNSPYGEYFQGRIDEVRIYSRTLTPTEIRADMATPH